VAPWRSPDGSCSPLRQLNRCRNLAAPIGGGGADQAALLERAGATAASSAWAQGIATGWVCCRSGLAAVIASGSSGSAASWWLGAP